MKKFLLWLLTLSIALPTLARDFEYTFEGQTLTYTVLDEDAKTCSAKKSSNEPSGKLEIPSTVFDGTNNFSVTVIGESAFSWCSCLTSVTIPNSVTSIGNSAFYECSGLTSVTIPNSVTTICNYAFYRCSCLTSVTIPNSVTSIGNSAFFNCSGLTSVTIPNSVTSIGDSAFSACKSLTSVTIPNSVTYIGDDAFSSCSGLISVTIPNSVASIGNRAFLGCNSLEFINVDSANQHYSSVEGVLFNKTQEQLIQYPAKPTRTSYTVPNSVTSIGDSAFSHCESLTSVTIPNSVTSIGNSAFSDCKSLTSVTIPNSVTSIGDVAFFNCSGLTSVTIPNSITSIGGGTFHLCKSLTSVTIPNSVTSIGNSAFSDCKSLTSVTIPNSVTSIGDFTFSSCKSLTSVTIPNSVTSIGDWTFQGCDKLTEIYCSAVEPPKCGYYSFRYVPTSCMVNVPENSVEAYSSADYWKNFSNIIGYYVPGGENEYLYIQDFFIRPGQLAYMPVRLRADRDYSDFTTDVYLPEGVEVVTAEGGAIDVLFARENGSHNISATSQPDGAIRVSVKSVDKALMASNGGDELFSIRVKATDLPNSSTLPVWFRNTSFKDADYEYLFNDTSSNIYNLFNSNLSDVESVTGAPVEFYNLQGQRIISPEHGKMYIRVQGGKATKVVI